MAVQQRKKSSARRNMRRSHHGLSNPTLSTDPMTGESHLRHHVSKTGYYRGEQVVKPRADKNDDKDE